VQVIYNNDNELGGEYNHRISTASPFYFMHTNANSSFPLKFSVNLNSLVAVVFIKVTAIEDLSKSMNKVYPSRTNKDADQFTSFLPLT
jgi:hypothetical protein